MNLVRGKLIGHARGFAFVVPDEKKTGRRRSFHPAYRIKRCASWRYSISLVPNRVVRVKKVPLYAF